MRIITSSIKNLLRNAARGATILFVVALASWPFPLHAASGDSELPQYRLSVSFDIEKHLLSGTAKISFPEGKEYEIQAGLLEITSVMVNGKPIEPDKDMKVSGVVEISYSDFFEEAAKYDIDNVGVVYGDVVGKSGISLVGLWYPQIEGMAYFELTALVPEDFKAISEADEITLRQTPEGTEYTFSFPYPIDGINFMAAQFEEVKDTINGIDVYAYFLPEDVSQARNYIDHTKEYLKMYSEMLGPYPYKRFSVVENFLPTGYSMPTYTLLGQAVVRLPFIVDTSLGHEVLHQWFGNYVYADYEKGNWIEGITSYLADQYYDELDFKGPEHRKKLLIDYLSYVNDENEIPLSEFEFRTDFPSRAIGYAKCAMVFHMLRSYTGDEAFFSVLRQFITDNKFKRTTWADIKAAFEAGLGEDLAWFFDQWVRRTGLLDFDIEDPRVVFLEGVPTVRFRLIQKEPLYRYSLSVRILSDSGEVDKSVSISKKTETIEIPVEGTPLELIIDGQYDLARRLSEDEYPPVVSRIIGDKDRILVVPAENREIYEGVINLLGNKGFKVIEEDDLKSEDIISSSILILGKDSPILRRLFADGVFEGEGIAEDLGYYFIVLKNPISDEKVVAVAYASSREEADLAASKIYRYGKYSMLRFRGGRNIVKKIPLSEYGVRIWLQRPVVGISPGIVMSLEEIIDDVIDTPVIFIGEGHTQYEDHKVQLDVIKALKERGRTFAIGMEMFQRPYQEFLDEYIAGDITEEEFLKSSQYFERWKFDYHLYQEIVNYAKAFDIPIIALNLDGEIIRKVARGGLDALSDLERADIPENMDMSDLGYKRRLEEVFSDHDKAPRNFEYFYQSQILWDETMALSIQEYLKENPDRQVVVVAGAGHIAYGSGIPKRLYRRTGKDYVTIVNVKAGTRIAGMADYILFPEPENAIESPKLGVMVEKDKKDGRLVLKRVAAGGLAERAGMKLGDKLLSVDGKEITAVDDIHIALFEAKPEGILKVTVLRERFILPDKKMEFEIKIP